MISHRDEDYDDDVVNPKELIMASLATALILGLWIFLSSVHIA